MTFEKSTTLTPTTETISTIDDNKSKEQEMETETVPHDTQQVPIQCTSNKGRMGAAILSFVESLLSLERFKLWESEHLGPREASFIERLFLLCPLFEGSTIRGSTVVINSYYNVVINSYYNVVINSYYNVVINSYYNGCDLL